MKTFDEALQTVCRRVHPSEEVESSKLQNIVANTGERYQSVLEEAFASKELNAYICLLLSLLVDRGPYDLALASFSAGLIVGSEMQKDTWEPET